MSVATNGKPTAQERTISATQKLCNVLGLTSLSATDLKYLTIALAEVASEEASSNTNFANRVQRAFQDIAPAKKEKKKPVSKKETNVKLIPIKEVDQSRFNPYALPDPFALYEAFGKAQLPLALERYPLTTLRQISASLEKENPGTKPKNKNQKESIVDYIVALVVRQG